MDIESNGKSRSFVNLQINLICIWYPVKCKKLTSKEAKIFVIQPMREEIKIKRILRKLQNLRSWESRLSDRFYALKSELWPYISVIRINANWFEICEFAECPRLIEADLNELAGTGLSCLWGEVGLTALAEQGGSGGSHPS